MPSITIRSIMEDLRAENEALRGAIRTLPCYRPGLPSCNELPKMPACPACAAHALLPKEEKHAKTE